MQWRIPEIQAGTRRGDILRSSTTRHNIKTFAKIVQICVLNFLRCIFLITYLVKLIVRFTIVVTIVRLRGVLRLKAFLNFFLFFNAIFRVQFVSRTPKIMIQNFEKATTLRLYWISRPASRGICTRLSSNFFSFRMRYKVFKHLKQMGLMLECFEKRRQLLFSHFGDLT